MNTIIEIPAKLDGSRDPLIVNLTEVIDDSRTELSQSFSFRADISVDGCFVRNGKCLGDLHSQITIIDDENDRKCCIYNLLSLSML